MQSVSRIRLVKTFYRILSLPVKSSKVFSGNLQFSVGVVVVVVVVVSSFSVVVVVFVVV